MWIPHVHQHQLLFFIVQNHLGNTNVSLPAYDQEVLLLRRAGKGKVAHFLPNTQGFLVHTIVTRKND